MRDLRSILALFELNFVQAHPAIPLEGSPERCLFRTVVETSGNTFWVLEELAHKQVEWRQKIGILLQNLTKQKVPYVHPCKPCSSGEYVLHTDSGAYQLSPFIKGIPLPRPQYLDDEWRGACVGNFIASLQQAGEQFTIPASNTPPMPSYIAELSSTIAKREPALYKELQPVINYLTPFLEEQYPILPYSLAHGDVHPVNIIWGQDTVNGVIDWEFAGAKPAMYDAANCIGCAGFEHPDWLIKGFVPSIIKTMLAEHFESIPSLPLLADSILALRFAWLSEWLRKKDVEMIHMELDYMHIWLKHKKAIIAGWEKQLP